MKSEDTGSAADVARSIERRIMWKMASQWEEFHRKKQYVIYDIYVSG